MKRQPLSDSEHTDPGVVIPLGVGTAILFGVAALSFLAGWCVVYWVHHPEMDEYLFDALLLLTFVGLIAYFRGKKR